MCVRTYVREWDNCDAMRHAMCIHANRDTTATWLGEQETEKAGGPGSRDVKFSNVIVARDLSRPCDRTRPTTPSHMRTLVTQRAIRGFRFASQMFVHVHWLQCVIGSECDGLVRTGNCAAPCLQVGGVWVAMDRWVHVGCTGKNCPGHI